MPTNEQRRATAKRKLERQLERRAQQARRRRIVTIAAGAILVVAVVAAVVIGVFMHKGSSKNTAAPSTSAAASTSAQPAPTATNLLPPFRAPAGLGDNCQYPKSPQPAAKSVEPPRTGKVPTDPAQVSVSMMTDQGPIGLQLDNAKAPCTVNSFSSLAQKGFFNDTQCHRLTTSPTLGVLQCGDPKGDGTGGPGYSFANEYPTNQYLPDDPAAQQPILYPRGTLAMANTGAPSSNGSQFFLVYKDSQLPPQYTVFGTIDKTGLATLDKIAAGGVAGGGSDGKPAIPVTIKSVQLD